MTTRARKTKRNLSQKEREKKKMDDFIKHMEIEVDDRCNQLALKAEELQTKMRSELQIKLLGLSSRVRCITVREYFQNLQQEAAVPQTPATRPCTKTHDMTGNGQTVRRIRPPQCPSSARSPMHTRPSSVRRQGSFLSQTPAQTPRFDHRLPQTPSSVRVPRKGESLFSMNGSPLGEFATRATLSLQEPSSPIIAIELDNKIKELTNLEILSDLTEEQKKSVVHRVTHLQDKLSTLLDQLRI